MKLALILLGCFVCVSKQERYIWPLPVSPKQAVYKPLFYGDGLPAGYDVIQQADDQHQQNPDAVSRANNKNEALPVQNRFFVNLLTAALFTSTVYTTLGVTSTVTTATVIKCIPSTQFSSSTTACGRRRRAVDQLLLANADDIIQPNPPSPLETSAVYQNYYRNIEDTVLATPEIISSQKDEPVDLSDVTYQQRAFTTTVTSTVYTTSYKFAATSITSTVSVGISVGLLCLPSGYSIC